MIQEKIEKYHQKYHQPCDFGVPFWVHFGDILEPLLAVARFFEDLFSGTFAGHPQERFWTPKWNKREPKEVKMGPERIPK
jgi:hypothetical protein